MGVRRARPRLRAAPPQDLELPRRGGRERGAGALRWGGVAV